MKIMIISLVFFAIAGSCEARPAQVLHRRQLRLPFLPVTIQIPALMNLGICRDTFVESSLASVPEVLGGPVLSAQDYLQSIKNVMDKVPYRPAPVSSNNLKTMSQLYRFGMFSALSYCDNQNVMQNFAKVSVSNNSSLYTGRFKMKAVRDLNGNRYTIATDDETKQIIATWRGTDNMGNLIADMNDNPVKDLNEESFPVKNAKSGKPDGARFFEGFVGSLSVYILKTFDNDLMQAIKENSNYQLVFAGHSLGGAQAILAALHWHLAQQEPKIAAIYTYGMPILGNNEANNWVASELQSYNWVRAVSRGDLVPWGRVSDSAQFSKDLEEVYLPASKEYVTQPIICKGQMGNACSASIPCRQKQWVDHVWIGGISIIARQFCILG